MMTRTNASMSWPGAAFTLVCVIALVCSPGTWLQAAESTATDQSTVFDMDGRQIIQDEANVGIINEKLTLGINYRSVAGLGGLWSPPFVSSNFSLEGRVSGEKVPTSKWTWRPFQVERAGQLRDIAVANATTLIYGHRAVVSSFAFKNAGAAAVPLEFFTLGYLDAVRDWDFKQVKSGTETELRADGRVLTLRQGKMAIAVAIDSADWKWDVSGNLGLASATLPANQSQRVNVIIAIGSSEEATASANEILAAPDRYIAAAEKAYAQRVADMFDKLPVFESDNAQLVRWYNRSLVHFFMNRWDLPDCVLQPYYSTGSVNGGCVANYLYDFGEMWELFPLYDPAASREHMKQFLKIDLLKHYNFLPLTGTGSGPWYMVNQEKIIGLVYYYVLLTGDTAFLDEIVDGKTIRDHMVIHAMFGDDAGKPTSLIDYGGSKDHLELRRTYKYNHISPDLNLRRYANYLRAATLCDIAGKPEPMLRERAELLKTLAKERLWDKDARWFRFEDGRGNGELRYTIQMFKPIGSGVLDKECEEGLLSHLNEEEFLSAYGIHSMSKRDPAFDQIDIDNGGGGACTCFPPQIAERLFRAGHPKLGADILSRILWWGDAMPYWGDSSTANAKDYRRDTPLQCTFDGAAAAQCIIFGVFGVSAEPNGDIVFKPNQLPFAKKMALKGLKIRGHSFDVRIDGSDYEVRTGGKAKKSAIGQTLVFSTAKSDFQREE